ncbi:hypothetical protein BDBG_01245 [Blastomyces gilchristii SLH14081]|uniref:Mmc1 C-terminal domain-containing protein n=1 Tax=Blastomyces gilchristii (strain SLH14081) TaxID=559298 RepID=A0A179UDY9_BLAGS|nr:uncharacterized protein BDBG_01245 [Blastomyces gilchristii SLH14081]OAT04742.1 hypothetical protein BDBG_01245 [Blastomyces gilchristii SLH14081]
MPPKLHSSLSKQAIPLTEAVFFCPSCSIWRYSLPSLTTRRRNRTFNPRRSRFTSTFAAQYRAAHTVNITRNIPERFQGLYSALNGVHDTAANHVNSSRLQLALRGLETTRPVIRLAVLALDDTTTTARLVRLLLADPLSPKQAWEDYLEKHRMDGSRSLLIKYGDQTDLAVENSLVPTISIPSRTLQSSNLEILISPLRANSNSDVHITRNTFLVPTIAIQSTSTGTHTFIRYPVHKSMICGKEIDGLLAYTRLAERANITDMDSICASFDFSLGQGSTQKGNGISCVDIERAEVALNTFRESVQNAPEYEKGWSGSGVQLLIDWVSTSPKDDILDPSIKRLVGSLLDEAEESINAEENKRILAQQAKNVTEEVRLDLDRTVSAWAERAHTELRDTLNEGFANKAWRNLAWWKLFWHVDDVGMIISRVLRKKWLPEAEKEVVWIGGKIHQAGLLNNLSNSTARIQELPELGGSHTGELSSMSSERLWPTQISDIRDSLTTSSVPSLHSVAQNLVFFSLSTTSLSAALSALVYISTSGTSMYEAGTIATIGLFVSLRRQQKGWDSARSLWEHEVREEGRRALRDTEEVLRTIIHEGGRAIEEAPETEARQQIHKARQALSDVK